MKKIALIIFLGLITSSLFAQKNNYLIPVYKATDLDPCYDEGESDRWGYINQKGDLVVDYDYNWCSYFSGGMGLVQKGRYPNQLFGYVNSKGKRVIGCNYTSARDFSDGLAYVESGNIKEFINTSGQTVFRLNNDIISFTYGYFSQGLCVAVAKSNNKYGFINRSGSFTIPPQFDQIAYDGFSENLCAVRLDGKWGFINKSGKVVIDYQFENVRNFSEGLAAFKEGDYWGFIDIYGNTVISPAYTYVEKFSEGLCAVQMGKRYIYINRYDENVFPSKSIKQAEPFEDGVALIINDDDICQLIDLEGDIVKEISIPGITWIYNNTLEISISDYPCSEIGKSVQLDNKGNIIWKGETHYSCFPANTSITLIDNSTLSIKDIKKGMQILSYNANTKKTEFAIVKELEVHNNQQYSLTRITFINSAALYTSSNNDIELLQIEGTENHPILTTNGYKPLGNITENDKILYFFDNEIIECSILQIENNYKTVNEVFNIKLENGNSYIINNTIASPKCPFVYVKQNGTYTQIDEILKNQVSDKLDKYDYLEIPFEMIKNNTIEIKIAEQKDEISYLDHIYLQVGDQIIEPECNNTILQLIKSNNNKYHQLQKGDYFELKFILPQNIDKTTKIQLVAKGYYELN